MRLHLQLLHFDVHQSGHTAQNLSNSYFSTLDSMMCPGVMLANQTTDNAANELAAARLVLVKKGFWKEA